MSFREQLENVLVNLRLNTDFFAETVSYRSTDGTEISLDVHVRESPRQDKLPDGTTELVESIHVEFAKSDLETPPDFGDRVLRAGDEWGYMYYQPGRHTAVSWKATFRRKKRTTQSTGRAKAA